ncbi:MAG: SsrA-binding protein SmpB [Planctomycetes bacterium]|nr:SsrA-binding protein SmpB [Planctomycetota bacterium]MCB9903977.1 SsrA-binding protein SmpB [Planctomycetota bacterium]
MAKPQKPQTRRSIATNRRARHEYEVLDELECGIVLVGSEVKSLRAGHASIAEAFGRIKDGELWLCGATIAEYPNANIFNHVPVHDRKLLVHRGELEKWHKRVKERGVTVVPLELYFQGSRVKCLMALCRGKKLYDKRRSERDKEDKRSMDRAMNRRR